ncbi:MAG: glycosyltransferase family 4 protein [Candidatus Niyogibacteria bacterium]|nr:glycosyltransferase family 4 protein [Candidatus Niyogibacteria bacterium]
MARKILYIITKSNWGGAQRYVYDLATHLPADFTAVAAFGGFGALSDKLKSRDIRTIPIARLERDIRPRNDIAVFLELFRLFRHERPDIVHLNSSKMAFLGAPAARLAGVPLVVFTAHGWPFNEDRPRRQKIVFRLLVFFSLLFTDRVIAVSDAVRNDVRRFPFIAKKITVIHNGIEIPAFRSKAESRTALAAREPRLASLPPDTQWLGINAELHRSKGIAYAIRAAELLSVAPVTLCIISSGDEHAALTEQIRNAKLENRVFLLGYIHNAAEHMKAFDIFLLPSITEALGYVLLEAGAAELPVIASRVGGIPEVIRHEETGFFVPPRDPAALAAAIEFFLAHPTDARTLGESLKQCVQKNFSLDRMLEQTFALYRSL